MSDVLDFITARLEADEARARAAQKFTNRTPWRYLPSPYGEDAPGSIEDERIEQPLTAENIIAESIGEGAWGEHIADNDPDAALRRCVLIRAMLDHAEDIGEQEHELNNEYGTWHGEGELITATRMHRDIAAYWSTHPEWRPEWCRHTNITGGEVADYRYRWHCQDCDTIATHIVRDDLSDRDGRASLDRAATRRQKATTNGE